MKQKTFNLENLLDIFNPEHFTDPNDLPAMGNELPIFGRDLRSTMEIDLGEAEIDKLLVSRVCLCQWRRCSWKWFVVGKKYICIWDMLIVFSCWWVDDCWVAWYVKCTTLPVIWKWWFRNICLYEHTNSIYVCMMHMYLINDSYTVHIHIKYCSAKNCK